MPVSLPSVCVRSANCTVRSITIGYREYTVSELQMRSPIGRNAQYCSVLFDMVAITKMMAWIRAEIQLPDSDYDKLKIISELLCVQHHSMN